MTIIGADGCRAGWFLVILRENGTWKIDVVPDMPSLWVAYNTASTILVDIPIGLKDTGMAERRCDILARKILGQPRGSSVFRVPCRTAIYEDTREAVSAVNNEITGTGVSPYTWGIVPKIREMDVFIRSNTEAKSTIRESHPEVCFWALSGNPMHSRKGEKAGFIERYELLTRIFPDTAEIVETALTQYPRSQVKRDDVLDALCMALNVQNGNLVAIPEPQETDNEGLDLAMWFTYHALLDIKRIPYRSETSL